MKCLLSCSLLAAWVLTACAGAPSSPAALPAAAGVAGASAFGRCKDEAATRNLPLAQHQEALFDCARRHAGKRGEACLRQLILNKTRVSDFEQEMAYCLRMAPAT